LYALYPGLAVLLAYAIDVYSNPRVVKRVLPLGALVLYLTLVSVSVGQWISSGVPREESSWRGSWALTDGNELYKNLADLGVEKVYANAWTRWSLLFALRKTRYMDADKPAFGIYYILPILPKAQGRHVAFVLHSGGQIIKEVEKAFLLHEIQYKRLRFHKLVILWGLDASQIHWKIGLPEIISEADWQPMPLKPDGFN
jgi:hypothetical protein